MVHYLTMATGHARLMILLVVVWIREIPSSLSLFSHERLFYFLVTLSLLLQLYTTRRHCFLDTFEILHTIQHVSKIWFTEAHTTLKPEFIEAQTFSPGYCRDSHKHSDKTAITYKSSPAVGYFSHQLLAARAIPSERPVHHRFTVHFPSPNNNTE